jgi:hypothetical protein
MANNSTIPSESQAAMLANLPAAGQLNYFFNTDKGGNIWSVDSTGKFSFVAAVDDDCCTCKITDAWLCGLNEGLLSGNLTAAEYQTLLQSGLTINSTNTGGGNCTIAVGLSNAPVVSVTMNGKITTMAARTNYQLTDTVSPSNAPQGVFWISSAPTIIAVDQTGKLFSNGTTSQMATITVYSIADPTKFDTTTITIV